MKLFREYLLDSCVNSEQTIYLPKCADIVDVNYLDNSLKLLALVVPEELSGALPELRTFKICTTEENLYFDTIRYIGSFKSSLGIRLLIEIIKEN